MLILMIIARADRVTANLSQQSSNKNTPCILWKCMKNWIECDGRGRCSEGMTMPRGPNRHGRCGLFFSRFNKARAPEEEAVLNSLYFGSRLAWETSRKCQRLFISGTQQCSLTATVSPWSRQIEKRCAMWAQKHAGKVMLREAALSRAQTRHDKCFAN